MTIDRESHPLSPNFTVFATQNPVEYEGTYPLPEAQKDRFMLKIQMNAPSREEEILLAQRMLDENSPEATLASGAVQAVISADDLVRLRHALHGIPGAAGAGGLHGGPGAGNAEPTTAC